MTTLKMEPTPFWADVNAQQSAIEEGFRAGDPATRDACVVEGGALRYVWLTSVANRAANTTVGLTCAVPLRLGAQRIVEGGHRLARAEEIQQFHEEGRRRKAETDVDEARLRKDPLKIALPPEVTN